MLFLFFLLFYSLSVTVWSGMDSSLLVGTLVTLSRTLSFWNIATDYLLFWRYNFNFLLLHCYTFCRWMDLSEICYFKFFLIVPKTPIPLLAGIPKQIASFCIAKTALSFEWKEEEGPCCGAEVEDKGSAAWPGMKFRFCHFSATWQAWGYMTWASLNFLIHEIGVHAATYFIRWSYF